MHFRILGQNAAVLLSALEELGFNKFQARVRMRGIGSGFYEGPNQTELQEPMHFNVSADTEEVLKLTCEKLKGMIQKCKSDLGV